MSYNYELCFWDPNDEGVNILLEHVSAGIKSCSSMVNFFKQRGELEKDYARRLGAINSKLRKDMDSHPEYGKLSNSFELALTNEKARAQAHSKQSEVIYRQIFGDIKSFADKLQARYTTLSGKVERLRMDKFNKKVGCEDLEKRLEEARVKARDLQLNADNLIGAKRNEHNQRELTKWETTAQEMGMKLDVLKQEHKASQKYWFREWAGVSRDLQEMETSRISFLKTKLQQYAESTIETSVLEQTRMDALVNQLVTYTPSTDITEFSSAYGTGRLREKRRNHHSRRHREHPDSSRMDSFGGIKRDDLNATRKDSFGDTHVTHKHVDDFSASKSRKSSYMDNLRRLSSHLQNIGNMNESRSKRHSTPPAIQNNKTLEVPKEIHHEEKPREREDVPHENFYKSTVREARVIQPSSPPKDLDDAVPYSRYIPTRLSPAPAHTKELSSSSSATSSDPTDFTTHVKNRHSMDSMATSVSSFINNIDDSQRFAKSWNSENRKRKSLSHLNQKSPPMSPPPSKTEDHSRERGVRYTSRRYDHVDDDDDNDDSYHGRSEEGMRDVSTDTTIVNPEMNASASKPRRKSLVVKDSVNPIDDALYEMQKISSNGFAASDVRVGRIRDDGITVTLPLVTSDGENVIKYAKAVYPLSEENVPELAQFQKGDYLLITAEVNEEWYRGEVYSNDYVGQGNSSGLVPHNFIKLLT